LIKNYYAQDRTSKIVITILFSIIIAFSLFWVFMNYANPIYLAEKDFYSKEFSTGKKTVFILGSSYVGQINANIVNEFISNYTEEYVVYNLSVHTDVPKKRLKILDKTISLKPSIVIYGIGFGDLGINEQETFPFDLQIYFKELFPIENFWDVRQTPKDITLDFILNIITYSSFSNRDEFNPFYPQKIPVMSKIRSNEEFENRFEDGIIDTINHIPPFEKNDNAIALRQIIKTLKENNIDLVIFTTPYNRIYLDHVGENVINDFRILLDSITSEYGIKIYDLQSKYADLDVWADPAHVAYNNNNTIIFPEDISKIILKEIND